MPTLPENFRSLPAIRLAPGWALAGALLLTMGQAQAAEAEKPWNLSASIGYRYDDSVTTDENDTSSGKKDRALVFDVGGSWKLLSGGAFDLEAGYDFSQTLHNTQSDFDLQSHMLSLSAEKEVDDVDTGLAVQYTRTVLGGDDFLGIFSLTPSAGYLLRDWWYTSGSYNYLSKNFTHSDGRDADQHGFALDNFFFPFEDTRSHLSLSYRIEHENTGDPEYDYLGQSLSVGYKTPLEVNLPYLSGQPVAKLSYKFSMKDYDNITDSINATRDDKRHTLKIGFTLPITSQVSGLFDYEYIDAISNLKSSDYEENIVTVSARIQL